jgi:hypothetical protein
MPAYNANTALYAIFPGDSIQVWNAEAPAAGTGLASASQQIAAADAPGLRAGIKFQGFFSGAPGAFEVDVQGSDVDSDTQYQTLPSGNITTVDATNQTFTFEDANANYKFYRGLLRTRTNAVNITGNFKR